MSRYMPIEANLHAHAGWLPYTDYQFAAGDALAPVTLEEVPHVLKAVPLAFRRLDEGLYQLVAVQALTGGLNLCVAPDGRWLSGYVPACYRAHPFRLQPSEDRRQWRLCVDVESGLWLDDARQQGECCFTEDGVESSRLANIRAFLEKLVRGRILAARAVKALAAEGLIQPWPLKTQDEHEQTHEVEGLYRIDEPALNALPEDRLAALRDAGGLSLAYAQLLSQHRLNQLAQLYRLRHAVSPPAESLDEWFDGDEELHLDFDS
ncbi:SapC family protein [Halomonas organivorans]|uniref:Peptidase n=1 Tax=Halomonas organivorans TaxID=257772 RepID=A0A7W5G7F1_9GAMM|nr:SapC family protein [Halomonas organivorans]MBB3142877.1 hypothetical protein [Halomonas organivorans]